MNFVINHTYSMTFLGFYYSDFFFLQRPTIVNHRNDVIRRLRVALDADLHGGFAIGERAFN